jgi:hypothetical protein
MFSYIRICSHLSKIHAWFRQDLWNEDTTRLTSCPRQWIYSLSSGSCTTLHTNLLESETCWRALRSKTRRLWRLDWRTIKGDSSLTVDELAWCSVFRSSSSMKVGVVAQVKFIVLSFRVKIQGLALIGCASQWPYWRYCFESEDYLQGENIISLIGRRRRLCTVLFLKASLLESQKFRCRLGGGCIVASRARIP